MKKAFVLGAGLGTRLRPLTDLLPKPLVPVFHRPLASWAFDHLASAGIEELIVNTHHLPDAWTEAYPENQHGELSITFRHEEVLLETAGGIANIADLLDPEEPLLVYNGDLLTDLPLARAAEDHRTSGREITLVLRSGGPALRVLRDQSSGDVTAIGPEVEDREEEAFQFTGIYFVSPAFLERLEPGKKESVRPIFQRMIKEGTPPGSVVVDEGFWADLGDRDQYLDAHANLPGTGFPLHGTSAEHRIPAAVAEETEIDATADIDEKTFVGPGSTVSEGAVLRESVLWPGSFIAPGTFLDRCIVTGQTPVRGLGNEDDL